MGMVESVSMTVGGLAAASGPVEASGRTVSTPERDIGSDPVTATEESGFERCVGKLRPTAASGNGTGFVQFVQGTSGVGAV